MNFHKTAVFLVLSLSLNCMAHKVLVTNLVDPVQHFRTNTVISSQAVDGTNTVEALLPRFSSVVVDLPKIDELIIFNRGPYVPGTRPQRDDLKTYKGGTLPPSGSELYVVPALYYNTNQYAGFAGADIIYKKDLAGHLRKWLGMNPSTNIEEQKLLCGKKIDYIQKIDDWLKSIGMPPLVNQSLYTWRKNWGNNEDWQKAIAYLSSLK